MKRFNRRRKNLSSREEMAPTTPRLWWNANDQCLLWLHGTDTKEVKSLDRLEILAEDAAYVLVSSRRDQYPARLAAIEVFQPQRVKIALADRWSSGRHSNSRKLHQKAGKAAEAETVFPRSVVDGYDVPLTRLQGAVFNSSTFGDPLEAFANTWMGKFHRFWGLSINHAAAKLWAWVGDILEWLAPPEVMSPDLSDSVDVRETRSRDRKDKKRETGLGTIFILLFSSGKPRRPFPSEEWPLRDIATRIVHHRAVRDFLPMAWGGETDAEIALKAKISDPTRPLGDPRAWLWRGLLRSSLANVNHAYVECMVAWVLSRLIHPELFPPDQPLLDSQAIEYWRNHRRSPNSESVC